MHHSVIVVNRLSAVITILEDDGGDPPFVEDEMLDQHIQRSRQYDGPSDRVRTMQRSGPAQRSSALQDHWWDGTGHDGEGARVEHERFRSPAPTVSRPRKTRQPLGRDEKAIHYADLNGKIAGAPVKR